MTLQSSGAISLSDIRDEYNNGSSAPIAFDDYYRGGSLVRANASNNTATNLSADVPTSANNSSLSVNDFYGQSRAFRKTYSSTATNQSGVGVFGDDFAVNYPKEIVINASQTVGATSTAAPALKIDSTGAGTITITNNGSIEGAGGAAGATGGNALQVDGSVSVTLVNNGTIKAGGGGGGNGGAGGTGSGSSTASISNVTDKVGDKPDFVPYSVLTQFGPRAWSGIGGGQWGLNTSGNPVSSNISNMGPMWYSFEVNTSAEYSLSSSISDPFPEDGQTGHRGTPLVNISTSEDTKSQGQGGADYGSGLSWSGLKAPLSANTLYYFCNYTVGPYGSSTPSGNFFYNDMSSSLSLSINVPTSGGSAGAGGVGQVYNQSAGGAGSGGSGGSNAGNGGAGGAGGAFGASGSAGSAGSNGSGTSISFPSTAPTNGASGSSGGASGKSIQGVSNVSSSGSGSLTGGTA